MSNDAETTSIGRALVGRPRIWQGAGFLVLGIVWLALAGPEPWRWVVGGAWIAVGGLQLVVALVDHRNGCGRYAPVSRATPPDAG